MGILIGQHNMITCPTCGKPLAKSADICPHCGHTLFRERNEKFLFQCCLVPLLIILVLAIILIVIMVTNGGK